MDQSIITKVALGTLELINGPLNWTRGTNARDVLGSPVSPYSHQADCFCVVGASLRACQDLKLPRGSSEAFCERLRTAVGQCEWEWNDNPMTKHGDVLRVVGKIARTP